MSHHIRVEDALNANLSDLLILVLGEVVEDLGIQGG